MTTTAGSVATDTSTALMATVTAALQDGVGGRKRDGVIADYLQVRPRNTAAALTSIEAAPTTIIRMSAGASSSVARRFISTAAWIFTDPLLRNTPFLRLRPGERFYISVT